MNRLLLDLDLFLFVVDLVVLLELHDLDLCVIRFGVVYRGANACIAILDERLDALFVAFLFSLRDCMIYDFCRSNYSSR